MSDPQRSDRHFGPDDAPDRDREGQVEELLVSGLDHYFAGRYDLAINVWTRVLFLDRGHARARAYIERARGAIGERHREGDELLHTGAAAFNRGDTDDARRLLTSAVERGASPEEALALLDRLDRLDVARTGGVEGATPGDVPAAPGGALRAEGQPPVAVPAPEGRSKLVWVGAGVIAGIVLAVGAALVLWEHGAGWAPWTVQPAPAAAAYAAEPLPVPSASEVWMSRGRGLYAKGRLHDALRAFEAVRPGDPLRAEADACRAAIQRQLLAAARGSDLAPPPDAFRSCGDPRR
jgi:hypothetical protein